MSCLGGVAEFSVQVDGVAPLEYQWQFKGVDIPGATESNVVVDKVTPADVGVYRCRVSDGCDLSTFSQDAVLTVDNAEFSVHPQGDSLCVGDIATMLLGATGRYWPY